MRLTNPCGGQVERKGEFRMPLKTKNRAAMKLLFLPPAARGFF